MPPDSEDPSPLVLSSRLGGRLRLRSTTGCTTCRQRHVKCDERKPTCSNCSKRGRPCHYASRYSASTRRSGDARGACQPTSLSAPEEDVRWASRATNAESTTELDLSGAVEGYAGVEADRADESVAVVPADFATGVDSSVSPFLATLGSILLDADFTHDNVEAPNLQQVCISTEPSEPSGHVPSKSAETLRVNHRIQLTGTEIPTFQNYVNNVSLWIDSFSKEQLFHRQIPDLALHCPVLLHSCLALSSKQLNLVGIGASYGLQEGDVVHYYRLALSAIRRLLLDPDSAQSDEVLAACIILSTYEMLDVVGDSLGSHLVGIASLLQTRQVHGDAGGMRGSCYWTWYRHEVWIALRTRRRLSLGETYWSPPPLDSFEHLPPEDIGNRVIFLLGQCIDLCNDDEGKLMATADEWLRDRSRRAAALEESLDDWKRKLPSRMLCYASTPSTSDQMELGVFGTTWFISPQSAIANQVFHASKILLNLHHMQHRSTIHGWASYSFLSLRKKMESHRQEILHTANSNIPSAWSLVSSQCLYVAGLVTEGQWERQKTLKLIDQCQHETGRRTGHLSDDLRAMWEKDGMDA